MSSATQPNFRKDAWQTPRNARTLRAFMALRNQEIAERIVELRKRRHLPQSAVWDALGVSERGYQNWESGRTKPNYTSLQKLAEFFGVTEGYILEGVDDRPVVEGVPEQLDDVDEKFTKLVADVRDQLGRVERKLDRLMHMVDEALFVTQPEGERDEERREHPALRGQGLGEVLAEILTDPQALEALRAQSQPETGTPRTARARDTRQGA